MVELQRGTRVVLRVAVPGSGAVLPAGTVAEIVRVSEGEGRPYRLRFLDGHEADAERGEFVLLSEAAEVPGPGSPAATSPGNLRERIVYQAVVGSRAYGLETSDSDTDRRGIYQAPTELVLSLYDPPAQLEDEAAQECHWELRRFLVLALKANPTVLEVLYSPLVEICLPVAEELLSLREAFLSRLVYQTYNGYVLSQFKKMVRTLEGDRPPNWKHAMHLIRLLESGITILETGALELRTAHRDALLEIRGGAWPWERVDRWRRELHRRFERAYAGTNLPGRPDYAAVDDFLVRARRRGFGSPA